MYTLPVLAIMIILIFGALMVWSEWSTQKLLHPQKKKLSSKADQALYKRYMEQLEHPNE